MKTLNNVNALCSGPFHYTKTNEQQVVRSFIKFTKKNQNIQKTRGERWGWFDIPKNFIYI